MTLSPCPERVTVSGEACINKNAYFIPPLYLQSCHTLPSTNYSRDFRPNSVFASATYLIYQTNQLMITVKNKCE